MELKIRQRDYVSDGAGGLVRLGGEEELLQRVLYKLSTRRGSFALMPELGSRLHLLRNEKPAGRATAAKQYIAEALAGEGISVSGVTLRERDGALELEAALRRNEEETTVRVSIGGE